jgi:surface antigen
VVASAHQWNEYAAASGWEVSTQHPVARSVVVFERGVHGASSQYGHVGWVIDVVRTPAGYDVSYVDLNGDGKATSPTFVQRTVPHVGGMSYILAPAPGASA